MHKTLPLLLILIATPAWCDDVDLSADIKTLVPGVKLTMIAEHPVVMTPTGVDVDRDGNAFFVCSHTHFRPDDYDGPEHDEVVRLSPDGDRTVFYNATDATMDLELASDGSVFLAQRDRILVVRDTDGDSVGDAEQTLVTLVTEGTYPHNGLSGMAWHPSGDLVFALGENHWEQWTLTGTDGANVIGTGEGGIFRCSPDGSKLRRIAAGFWNPFGVCVRRDGTMFACENDPGARPPCRLLQIVEGGKYGYQRLYGNAPHHPFVCWNGELPGTLPMLFSLGEAPCGIAPMGNGLLVTSWTDHRIDFYPLTPSGATFKTDRISLVTGSNQFRPTCITQVSPTVFYLTDWVVGSYSLHGKGRLWKLEIDPSADARLGDLDLDEPTQEATLATQLRSGESAFDVTDLLAKTHSTDAFIARAAIDALATLVAQDDSLLNNQRIDRDQMSWLLATRKANPKSKEHAAVFLDSVDSRVRFEALRWIADEQLDSFLPQVKAILSEPETDYRLFEAALAAHNILSGNPRAGIVDEDVLLERVLDPKASSRSRAFALRLLDPDSKKLAKQWSESAIASDHVFVQEAIATLNAQGQSSDRHREQLVAFSKDQSMPVVIRADAMAARTVADDELDDWIRDLSQIQDLAVREEALRNLRGRQLSAAQISALTSQRDRFPGSADLFDALIDPDSIQRGRPETSQTIQWRDRLAAIEQPVDVDAGRRIFHHRSIGACWKCHRHTGRGRVVGPDLSAASTQGDPDRLLKALLQPSLDVDPQYFPRLLILEGGKAFTGIMLRDGGGGREYYRDSAGKERMIKTSDIEIRKELSTSMMPDGLIDTMTGREIRDVLAFLDREFDAEPDSGAR
ncbi:PVC-type heme-binding CxxCH protein [Planctomycetes bacterium K23_9]|uniref:Cytochrome c domain-containing protein n=1 Tax=Stieleria marina TaxID=1930275 RepID=A0A517NVN5_9BACT|nr:hypothetical protein K239x_31870 [Planctomycetes bacterium K23_9]